MAHSYKPTSPLKIAGEMKHFQLDVLHPTYSSMDRIVGCYPDYPEAYHEETKTSDPEGNSSKVRSDPCSISAILVAAKQALPLVLL
ncbi:hypothetical protein EUGRSUZ_B00454 [Eucalyptus grandis]|uniref:Uncharacterized protein n=2 Tax=Eucalyptus grandis TaxID=71139 RepID=A0ACC3LMT1_EUCGR|nr:hypothetical protein EUGRSUZ_B00454 [Eucalyptus grandis]